MNVIANPLPVHLADLHAALLLVNETPVECDGHTLMVSTALLNAGIPHERLTGSVTGAGGFFILSPHVWIRIGGYILDYRLRMWVSVQCGPEQASAAPHGIFHPHSFENDYQYIEVVSIPAPGISERILDFMTDGYASRLQIPQSTIAFFHVSASENVPDAG